MLARGTPRLRHTGSVATAMATPAKKALMQQNIRMSSTLVMTPSCKTMGATVAQRAAPLQRFAGDWVS